MKKVLAIVLMGIACATASAAELKLAASDTIETVLAANKGKRVTVRLRSGRERLQPDPRRPRRTLKNLFQEAGVPPWERERLPLLFCGDDLVWAPGLGVDARFHARRGARSVVPSWQK